MLPANLRSTTIQSIAAIAGNLLCLNFGLMLGTTPAHTLLYQSAELTPLTRAISAHDARYLHASFFLSAAIGALCLGAWMRQIGPKSVLMVAGLLQILAWFSVHFGNNMQHIYGSRVFMGASGGAAFAVLPVYIAEITETRERAAGLYLTIDMARGLGILIGALLAKYLRYTHVGIIGLVLACLFNLVYPFTQESPYHFMRTRNALAMEKALRWFRGVREVKLRSRPQFRATVAEFQEQMKQRGRTMCTTKPTLYYCRVLSIVGLLVLGAQMTGFYVLLSYSTEFLLRKTDEMSAQSGLLHGWTFIIYSTAQFLGTLCAACLAVKLKRKLHLSLPTLAAASTLIALLVYQLSGTSWRLNEFWSGNMSIMLLALYLAFINMGFYPLSTVISKEVLNTDLDMLHISLSALSWLLLSGVIMFFDVICAAIGITGILCCFLAICIMLPFILIFLMPETKGCSATVIEQKLGNISPADVPNISCISYGHITHITV